MLANLSRWFGRSKVTDHLGNPKIVYHGTTRSFDAFHARKRNPELGFHFGSVAQAEWFGGYDEDSSTLRGGNIRPVYLRIENPLRLPDIFVRSRESSEKAAYWLYRDGLIAREDCRKVHAARTGRETHFRFMKLIEAMGHDGIVYENDQEGGTWNTNEDSYVVFHPDQVRSAFE